MLKPANRFFTTVLLLIVFTILAFSARGAGTTTTQSVLVTNSAAQAVPVSISNEPNVHAFITNLSSAPVPTSVQGSVTIANNPLVASIQGTPTVSVSNTPNVHALITNVAGTPVPTSIQGTPNVVIANGSPVPTSIQGTPTVSVSNTPNVHALITNSTAAPVATKDVNNADTNSYVYYSNVTIANNLASNFVNFAAPSGKGITIDSVNATSTSDQVNHYATFVEVQVFLTPSNVEYSDQFFAMTPVANGNDRSIASATAHIFVPPLAKVTAYLERDGSNAGGAAFCVINLSGHEVSVP